MRTQFSNFAIGRGHEVSSATTDNRIGRGVARLAPLGKRSGPLVAAITSSRGRVMHRAVAALLAAAMVVLAVPVAAAQAVVSPELTVSVVVLARGAAARLTFDVRCPPNSGGNFYGDVVVTQPGAGGSEPAAFVARLNGAHCSSESAQNSILVLPQPGASALKPGRASVHAVLSRCIDRSDWDMPPSECEALPAFNLTTRLKRGQALPTPPNSSVRISSATVVSKGAAVRVAVEGAPVDSCGEWTSTYVNVLVSQRVGKKTTLSRASVTCPAADPISGSTVLLLPVGQGQHNFQPKRAFIGASVSTYTFSLGSDGTSVETVRKLQKQRS